MSRSSMRARDCWSTPAIDAAIRSRAVPSAPAAAHADPPPGVGDAAANASSTSRRGLSAKEATNQFSHGGGGDAVDREAFFPSALAADDPNVATRTAEEAGEIANELVVGCAVDRRRRKADEDGVVTFAVDDSGFCAGDDADIEFGAGGGRPDQPALNARTF